MSATGLEKVKREGERASTAESGERSVSHATSAVSDFRLKVCLDGAKKKKEKKDVVNHEDKSLLLPSPQFTSPFSFPQECLGSAACTQIVLVR